MTAGAPGLPSRWRRPAFAALLLAAGLGGGYLLHPFLHPVLDPPGGRSFPIRENRGRLTNPLLDFEVLGLDQVRELRPFETELRTVIAGLEQEKAAEEISVYFRDLNNGLWVGVGEEKEFVPGSLFKVPLILACLDQAEGDPGFLERKVLVPQTPPLRLAQIHYPPGFGLLPGKEYRVRELIQRTARLSDNTAAYLLQQVVDPERLKKVLYDLDIDAEKILKGESRFSAVEFGRFFRILYNASYLSRPMSELALAEFTASTFDRGLVAGLPPGTTIAHKFGEYIEDEAGGRKIYLHDAGIIYLPGHPYLLCVMTKGPDYPGLERSIASVSAAVWRQVQGQRWMAPAR